MIYVPGVGNPNAKLLILGEAPGSVETQVGLPFQGPSGRELDSLLKETNIRREDCWVTNVCKYEVKPSPYGKKKKFWTRALEEGIDFNTQLSELHTELNSIKPNCILALGGTALYSLIGKTSIQKYRGSILSGNGHKFVSTYHPAHILHSSDAEIKGYWNRAVMAFDFRRAKAQSEFPELRLPHRHIEICKDSGQLWRFYDTYKGTKRKVASDIEANGTCLPICIGLAFNSHHAMVVPLWNFDGISNIADSDLASCWILLDKIITECEVIGQNFKYDDDKLRRIGLKIRKLGSDLLLKSFTIDPELPKNLAFNTSIWTEEPFYKDEGMYEGSVEDLMMGCGRDACVTYEIDEKMDPVIDEMGLRQWYENFEIPLHDLYLNIENTGFRVDETKRDYLIDKYVRKSEQLQYEIFKLTGHDINVNSHIQVKKLLFEDLKMPARASTGEEELTAIIMGAKTDPLHKLVCEKVLEKRRVDKTVGTYMMALPDFDGRMKTTYFLCLETGRTRTSQLEPPIRPQIEVRDFDGDKKNKNIGLAFQTMTKHGDIGNDIREQFIPDEGEIFLQADSSQAEARVVFLLAGDEQALRDVDERDYHAWTASWFFGGTEQDYSKKVLGYEHPIRFGGKTLRHAGHLGAGAKRAMTELNTQARKYKVDIKISLKQAEVALNTFHSKQPKIRQVFHNGIIEALRNNGRKLTASVPYGVESKIGGVRKFYERWGDELFRQALSYIPQRAVSDNTKSAALRISRRIRGIKIILEAHDALLFSIPIINLKEWAEIIREEMERPIRFETCSIPRRDLVIPCDIETGENYMELKKFKMIRPEVIQVRKSLAERVIC
jgi:uracil-DNA glycosylase family 4